MRYGENYMNSERKKTLIQFIKFCVVGVSNTAVSLAVYYLFIFINPSLYQLGNVVGWIVGVLNSFYWNNRFVFHGGSDSTCVLLKKLGKTYVVYGLTWALSAFLLHWEIEYIHLSRVVSPLINLLVTIPLNFLLNKFWAFRSNKAREEKE